MSLARADESCQWLITVPVIGPIISSAMVAAIGNGAASIAASGGDLKRFPFATPEALGDSGLNFAALAHVKENITVRALL